MKEITEIVKAFDTARVQGNATALATVVQVEGSAYRRPGARMLVTDDGQLTGAISGGCLEGDALRKARLVIIQRQPVLVTYDTTDEDDAKLGVQLGCNGVIHILFEPIDLENQNNPIRLLKTLADTRQISVLVTCYSLVDKKSLLQGTCLLLTENTRFKSNCANEALERSLLGDARRALTNRKSLINIYDEESPVTAFVEVVEPAVSLIICGAGNDVVPLVEMARILGWQILIADGRTNMATAGRFPQADQVLVVKPDDLLNRINLDERSAVVLMTHNYNYDLAVLELLLPLGLAYIGSLGPKKKLQRMLAELEEKGINVTNDQLQTIYGPAGLDIGAETPEEIALSIIAEIKAIFSKRRGLPLREKNTPIHVESNNGDVAAHEK